MPCGYVDVTCCVTMLMWFIMGPCCNKLAARLCQRDTFRFGVIVTCRCLLCGRCNVARHGVVRPTLSVLRLSVVMLP